MRRQIAVRRVTRKSSAFHASRHRRSSAVWGKHQAEAEAARMSPSHWWMADSLRERHSCSLMSAESATIPPEVHHFAVLFSSFFLLLLWRSRRGIWEWGCWAPIDNIQIEGLWNCVVFACENESVLRCEMKFTFSAQQMEWFIFPGFEVTKIKPNEGK